MRPAAYFPINVQGRTHAWIREMLDIDCDVVETENATNIEIVQGKTIAP